MKTFNVFVSSKAQEDLADCIGFVLNVSKEAAMSLAQNFEDSISSLRTYPERNPIFEMPKSFPLVIRKQIVNNRYIILYAIESPNVIVYRIIDSRRNFDRLLK
jgi:plasmid stabilization system protein ParE